MTEDEAKTKWCPFAKVAGENRWRQSLPEDEPWALNPVPCRCVGSACMAWRWHSSSASMDNPTRVPGAGVQTIKHEHGYCGLAGKP